MKNKKDIADIVLELIPKEQINAKTSRELMSLTGLTYRNLKVIITDLRKQFPICSKETDGGGYWIAESNKDIENFILMIKKRRDGYNRTMKAMSRFLTNR